MDKKVSVIIATYNRKEHLLNTLSCFNNQSYKNFEIVVVEDGSDYNQQNDIQNLKLNYKITYHYIKNKGRAGARNYGINNSNGEIILFFDDHSQPIQFLIEEHVKNHLKYKKHGGFRGRIEYSNDYTNKVDYLKPKLLANLHNIILRNNPIVNFGTHNLSVKRKITDVIGTLDEDFKLYGAEDQEIGIRIKKAGYKIGYLPRALCYNIRIQKNINETLNRAVESGKMAALLIKKHPEYKSQLGLNLLNKAMYDNKKNLHLYTDFIKKKINTEKVRATKKTKFILYYYSLIENLKE